VERFRAEVRQKGPNPYVNVPDGVSERLAPYGTSGRIRVTGRLAGAEFHATLVPVKGGGHVLFVPGGLRAATGVKVGDTVTVDVRAMDPGNVRPPEDLVSALERNAGARSAFARLPVAHQRELIRFLEDSRTPTARARRAEQVVAQALGREVRSPGRRRDRALWTCPSCGRSFVTRNAYHSCAVHTLEEPFAGKPPRVRELFDLIRQTVETFGPVTVVPYRDRVAFMVRVRFAGVAPRRAWVDVDFWLPRREDSPRLRRVETLSPSTHVHCVRVTDPADVDGQLVGWLREAYAVGCQEHLGPAHVGEPSTP
jgi:hypothetical protein